jgi:hypothetical protein
VVLLIVFRLAKNYQYNARQTALKLLGNARYGIFVTETDYRVSELITGYARLIHKELQKMESEKYGFTDMGHTRSSVHSFFTY